MTMFAIIELDDGLTVVPVTAGQAPEQAAVAEGGVLVDDGPYDRFEDAYDAMLAIPEAEEEVGDE